MVSNIHRHRLVIEDYLEDILRRPADARQNHPVDMEPGSWYLRNLLPDHWSLAHFEFVCQDRGEDQEMVHDAKRWWRTR